MIACTEPRSTSPDLIEKISARSAPKIPALSKGVPQHPRHPLASSPGLAPACLEETRESSHSPSPSLLPTNHCPLTCPGPVGVTAHSCFKSSRCNTYAPPRKCCKQKTYTLAKPFRCNTYKKQGVPPSSQMLFSVLAPPPVPIPTSHSPYTLPSSVSRISFICHSYENTGGVGVFFPFWNSPSCALFKASSTGAAMVSRTRSRNAGTSSFVSPL